MPYLDLWCVEKLLPNLLEEQCLETAKNLCLRKKKLVQIYLLLYFVFKLWLKLKMYTVLTIHAIFVVHCLVDMKPFNCTQLTNLQLYSNQSTNYNPWFGVRGPPKILLSWVSISVDQSLKTCTFQKISWKKSASAK